MVTEVQSIDEWNEIVKNNPVVVIDIFAEWCGPCKTLAPIFEDVSKRFPKVKFVKANVKNITELVDHFQVTALPTLIIVRNKMIDRKNDVFVGGGSETISKITSKLSTMYLE